MTEQRVDKIERAMKDHERVLMRYISRICRYDIAAAQDIVQEAFLRLWRARPFPEPPRPWLFRVGRNLALDRLKKEKRMTYLEEQGAEPVDPETPLDRALGSEHRTQLMRALQALPENQREVVVLKFQNGFSYKEISKITGNSVSNVGYLMHVGMTELRRLMTERRGL